MSFNSRFLAVLFVLCAILGASSSDAQVARPPVTEWATAWAASAHGAYPVGSAVAQPDLNLVIPAAEKGLVDQSLRMIVRPSVWGREARIRLSNAFGTSPVTFDGAFVGLQSSGSMLVPETNQPVRFGGAARVTVPAGGSVLSDAVALPWVTNPADPMLADRRLAVSFHIVGESGQITWHSKAMASGYISAPGAGSLGASEDEHGFPFSVMSWFFLDAVDMKGAEARTIVAFGDSITDGTGSTINGDDRWPDVLSRRLRAAYGNAYSVVNAGVGANMITGPADWATKPWAGGAPASERLERDVLSLSGVAAVIWLEGINDFAFTKNDPPVLEAAVRNVVARVRQRIPGVRIVMATAMSARNSTIASHGTSEVDEKRQVFNQFIRTSGLFDAVVDFDELMSDPKSGELKAEYRPNSSIGGPGDKLHPNRAGYAAMARAIDLKALIGEPK